jgi:hypothetical protein
MHREQHKCKLRKLPVMSRGAPAASDNTGNGDNTGNHDYSGFSANLHSAKLNLLPHMVLTAVVDACRGVKDAAKSASVPAATRATRR